MKLSTYTILAVAAGLVQASALRITEVAEPIPEANIPSLRFGRPVANNDDASVARIISIKQLQPEGEGKARGRGRFRPCKAMKEKAQMLTEAVKHALGWGGSGHANVNAVEEVHILPFIGTPPQFMEVEYDLKAFMATKENGREDRLRVLTAPTNGPIRSHAHAHAHHCGGRFGARLHRALMMLGKWEGRAVAFVLGCGLGVLLRMFWVLAVITFRTVRGAKGDDSEREYDYIVFEHAGDAEELIVPPPNYSIDEKVPILVEDNKQ